MITHLLQELKYYIKNKQEAINIVIYFVSILLLVPFAGKPSVGQLQILAVIALWVALVSSTALGGANLFRRERESGRLDGVQLLPTGLEQFMFAKWLAFFLWLLVPLALAIAFASVLYALPLSFAVHCVIGLGAGCAALSVLNCVIAALAVGLEKAASIISLVLLPLSIPILIFGASYCTDTTADSDGVLFLLGFAIFMLPVMCFGGAAAIRASN